MFPMRLKIGPSRNNEWRCLFCLHVRTATTLLGIWQLMLHVLALSILALLMRNHHNYYEKSVVRQPEYDNILPTPLSKTKNEDNPYYLPTIQNSNNRIHEADMDMGALMTVCTLGITLLLVYGTVKGKASHLLPFLCLQLFDFAITTLTATGYFVYLRSVHNFVKEHWHNMPFRRELLELSPQWLSLVVIALFFLCMLWKAYCISIVWRCYKYLTLRQQATHSVHYIMPGEGGALERAPEPDYSSLLPDYEAACASAMKQPPPPSYQAAMAAQLPTYPEAIHIVSVSEPEPAALHGIRRVEQQPPPPQSAVVTVTTVQAEPMPTAAAATPVHAIAPQAAAGGANEAAAHLGEAAAAAVAPTIVVVTQEDTASVGEAKKESD